MADLIHDCSGLVIQELAWRDPAAAFAPFADDAHVAWLDSQGPAGERARFSVLAADPFAVVPFAVGAGGDPFVALAAALLRYRVPSGRWPVPFIGGAVGFLGYEAAGWLERVPRPETGALGVPDAVFGLYDVVLVWDHTAGRSWLISSGFPQSGAARALRARRRAGAFLERLAAGGAAAAACVPLDWRQETGRAAHVQRVAQARTYIEAGDIYQANITARFLAARPPGVAASAIHLALRAANPAPYGAYLGCGGGVAIASVSPERFLRLTAAGEIEARPIKGTRPRGVTPAEDARLAAELLACGKDFSENLMIVDLLRNDIGRVAAFGSVTVPELAVLETFPHVHHLVSCVQGMLRPGLTAVDLLRAAFPGGSITGAPKLRAMEIIAALEDVPRGPYCGSIFWAGWDGAMDSSILIRTATITDSVVAVQAGGGIVADSDPAAEYAEMLTKVRPLLRALGPDPT